MIEEEGMEEETIVVPPTVSKDAPSGPHKGEPASESQPQPVYPDGEPGEAAESEDAVPAEEPEAEEAFGKSSEESSETLAVEPRVEETVEESPMQEPSESSPTDNAAETPIGSGGPQPLTRSGCEEAGMKWNENANVCDAG
ncbi:MAG: hypothetical protein ACR2J1_01360 [Methyloceanibacter sp.]|uniref:hypothetical protein n=1 Tax=Methyloceanibacter sp. TaxID=1965321 RepID=UPI003D9BD34F